MAATTLVPACLAPPLALHPLAPHHHHHHHHHHLPNPIQADAKDLLATATGSKDKDRAPLAYMLFGNGDGGGGPTVDMCESLARLGGCRGVAGSFDVTAPGDFFRRLEGASQDLLTW